MRETPTRTGRHPSCLLPGNMPSARAMIREVAMAETQPFDEFEVAETVYEILSRLYVVDKEGAAREAAVTR